MRQRFDIEGMSCAACAAKIEHALSKVDGINRVEVNLMRNFMIVEYDSSITESAIIDLVSKAGYKAFLSSERTTKTKNSEAAAMKKRLIWSIIFTVPLFYISMGHMINLPFTGFGGNAMLFSVVQLLLTIPVVIININFFTRGFKSLFKLSPNMDSLIAIGSSAALIYSVYSMFTMPEGLMPHDVHLYFESAAMILTLITLGKFLEARAKGKTSDAITKLINLSPKTAIVLKDGIETTVAVDELVPGDIIAVKSGDSIPADGTILSGSAHINESAITGESMPTEKSAGDRVVAGTVNESGYFVFTAEGVKNDTVLSQIIRLMEEASSSKAPISRLADKVSRIFVPVVIAIAVSAAVVWLLLGYGFEFALTTAISVLVISCPCALGLATPTAIMVATGKGVQNGILIKSAAALENAHKINTIILDKTGTITEGEPGVTDIKAFSGYDENKLVSIAASAESLSEHPLAKAITQYAKTNGIEIKSSEQYEQIPGRGISAYVDGKITYCGNQALMSDLGIHDLGPDSSFAGSGKTVLYFSYGGSYIGAIALADKIKTTSATAVQAMKERGVDVYMLTGDNKDTASAIAVEAGISNVLADVMPADKENQVRALQSQGRIVGMVGDGINDAPALARADVGIAIGAGTDIAIESADIVLSRSDLNDVVTLLDLSSATIRNIKQNLFWALFYNSLGIPLAAGVFYTLLGWQLNPMFAAAAMSLSSIFVVGNSLRLRLFEPKSHNLENSHNAAENACPLPAFSNEISELSENSTSNNEGTPSFNEKNETNGGADMIIYIEGMMCSHCTGSVEKALKSLAGVTGVTVDLKEKKAIVTGNVSEEAVKNAVTELGYSVTGIEKG